jgi:hypothetical protein
MRTEFRPENLLGTFMRKTERHNNKMDLRQMDVTTSGSCAMQDFGISVVGPSDSVATMLDAMYELKVSR